MVTPDCIFCKIIKKEIKSSIILETDNTLVIQDISPRAPIHYLILPKKHVSSLIHLQEDDATLTWDMLRVTRDLGKSLPSHAFNVVINNGEAAGQSVFHLHFHFLSGKNLYADGFSL